mgnify:CR=1 FL=1
MVTGTADGGHLAMGTQGYMAPEVADGGEVTPAADVYSLGVAFFRLLTNVWYDPCLAPSADSKETIGMNSLKLLQFFDYNWDEVLPQMLEADPQKRPLRLTELASCVRPKSHQAASSPWPKRIGVGAIVILAAAAGFFAVRLFRPPAHVGEPVVAVPEDRVAKEFKEAFGPANLILKEAK